MIKKELVSALAPWPDDAQIELAIPVDVDSTDPISEDKVWLEISEVETVRLGPMIANSHCLLFGGRVTMG